jgi:predicted permease
LRHHATLPRQRLSYFYSPPAAFAIPQPAVMRNLKLALRTLFKTPFVTSIAALSLALGIGANTAIYSLFDQMLRRPLPVHEPERLARLIGPGPRNGSNSCNQSGNCEEVFSYPMFKDLEKSPGSFASVAAHRIFGVNIAYEGQTLNADGVMISGSYFPTLGLQPALGRLIGPSDDQTIGSHYVAVLSHGFWESRLGSDRAALGKQMLINGKSMTIIGVAPKGFEGVTLGSRPAVFVPITMRGVMNPGFSGFENRRAFWAYIFARMKPGVTLEQAQIAINTVYKPIIRDVEAPLQSEMSAQTLERFKARELQVADARRGQSSIHREASTPILLLFSITGIVLLIACANIANLLLARAANRSMEMAVRLSLGASRRQLLAQLLTESVMLAVIGGVVSLVVAHWTLVGLTTILPSEATQSMDFVIQWPAVAFAAGISLATGLLFGLFPALHSTRPDLVTALRNNSGKLSGGRSAARFRSTLVTAQIALSMSLLIAAGLFIRSLSNVSRVNLGLTTENVVVFTISPVRNGYDTTRSKQLFGRLQEELSAMPGVTTATAGMVPILSGSNWGNSVRVEGYNLSRDPDVDTESSFNLIAPGYFKTLNITVLAGREFSDADERNRPRVAIVNEAFAKKFGLGRDVVGKRMAERDTGALDIEIVGLVRNAAYSNVKDSTPAQYFTPYRQDAGIGRINFYVKTAGDPVQLLRAIPGTVRRLDPNLPVEDLKTLPQQVRENVFMDRMISIFSASFAVVATLLAAIGLYGVLAYSVAQRTREIGVRMALGASTGNVRSMVLRQVGLMTLIGGIIGIGGAIALGRFAKALLFQIGGYDPAVMVASALALTLVALAAGFLPALRASRIDPMQALRYE